MGRKFKRKGKKKGQKGKEIANTEFIDSKGRKRQVRSVRSSRSKTTLYFVGKPD